MVDPIGAKPVSAERRATPVDAAVPVRSAPNPAAPPPLLADTARLRVVRSAPNPAAPPPEPAVASGLSGVVADLAAAPPVDLERVSRIRQAIANRTYPIAAETIADRLIALKLNWNPHEQA